MSQSAQSLKLPKIPASVAAALAKDGKLAAGVAFGVIIAQVAADPAQALTRGGMVRIGLAAVAAVWQAMTQPVQGAPSAPADASSTSSAPSDGTRVNAAMQSAQSEALARVVPTAPLEELR